MILDDENILIEDTRSGIGSNLNLIWNCRDHSQEDLLEIIKFAFSRNDLSKDLYWEESKLFENRYFLRKDSNNNHHAIILTLKIEIDRITLWLHERNMYYIFDMDIVHMWGVSKEFANWIKKLGFNPHPLVCDSDDIKEYTFKP